LAANVSIGWHFDGGCEKFSPPGGGSPDPEPTYRKKRIKNLKTTQNKKPPHFCEGIEPTEPNYEIILRLLFAKEF